MISQGYFIDNDALETYCAELQALHQDPSRLDLRWRLGIDDDVLDEDMRCREIQNWIESLAVA